jgi:hypothetical protein
MTQPPSDTIRPDEFPPELREALAVMSLRGPVRDLSSGELVAENGRMLAARPAKPELRAHLHQLDPAKGLRGWEVYVVDWEWIPNYCQDGGGAWVNSSETTLRTPLQKPGLRPPTLAQRRAALARLGYEPDDAAEKWSYREWRWQESEWSEGHPYLWAVLQVRPIEPAVTE